MRKTTILFVAVLLTSFNVFGIVPNKVYINGANGIADNSGYTTLKDAFDAINAQSDQSGKDIEIQIAGSTTETATAALNQPATASWNSLTIYPTVAAVEISGDFLGTLIDLYGADNVTITGKQNKTGAEKSLTIVQNGSGDNAARTIRLANDAQNNTISYCTIKGSCPSSGAGVIFFSTAATGGSGNNGNTISYNDITKAGSVCPQNGLYSAGTSGVMNNNNVIDNNNFYGIYDGNTTYAIRLGSHNMSFTITNNSIYEPNEVIPVAANNYNGIYVASGQGAGFIVKDNYIGGSAPMCGGNPFKKSNAFSNQFTGIFVSTSASLTDANEVQGNVIKNIEWKNTDVKKDFTCFSGFGNIANFGTTSANTITEISLENGAISGSVFYGYNIGNGSGLFTVKNNSITNIGISNPDGANGTSFYGIYKSNTAGEVDFSNNTLNLISLTGTSTANSQAAYGIYLAGTNKTYTYTVSGNHIKNLSNSSSRTDVTNSVKGIYVSSTLGSGSVVNNKIYNLNATDATMPASVAGIDLDITSTSTATICANNMITLGNVNPGLVYGILQNTGLAKVYNNSVYIAGSPATESFESAALVVSGTDPGREVKNNILYNARSNDGIATGKNYTVKYNATTDLASDYNVVNATGVGGLVGAVGATDYNTGEAWVIGTGLDTNSQVATVNFANVSTGDLTLTGASIKDITLKVPSQATVTTDFLGTTRNTTFTYAGAHESTLPFPMLAMQGLYTVGSAEGADFAKLSDAINAINEAISITGDIELAITSDITEPANFGLARNLGAFKLLIRPNADANRTITFTQETANTDIDGHFVIGYKTEGLGLAKDNQYLISTNNVTIDGYANAANTRRLKFTTSVASIGSSVLINIIGGSSGTTIKNAIFDTQSSGTNPTDIAITQYLNAPEDAAPSNTLIENNQITAVPSTSTVNGIGIQCARAGSATTLISNLNINNNTIIASGKAIEINYSNGANILGNEFKIQKQTGTGVAYGIWLRGKSGDMNILRNRFTEVSSAQASGTGGTQAILVGASATNPFNTNIFNNTFAGMDRKATGATNVNQAYIAEIGYGTTKIYHNSFYLPALTQPTQSGTYNAISFTTTNKKADVQNNIFISNEDAKSVLVASVITVGTVNNNIYYLRAGNTNARIVDTYATLAAYQTANTTLDVNSKSVDVNFVDAAAGDLLLTGASVQDANLKVPSIAAVTTDILGTTRNTEFTYAGAHESTLPFNPAGIDKTMMQLGVQITKTGIFIPVAEKTRIELYNISGVQLDNAIVTNSYSRALGNGIYIVKINGSAVKFVK